MIKKNCIFKDYSCEKDIRKGWKLWSEVVHNDRDADIFVLYYHLFRSLRIEDIEGCKQKQSIIKYIGLVLLVRFEERITIKSKKEINTKINTKLLGLIILVQR